MLQCRQWLAGWTQDFVKLNNISGDFKIARKPQHLQVTAPAKF
jgi:hypothetical protein